MIVNPVLVKTRVQLSGRSILMAAEPLVALRASKGRQPSTIWSVADVMGGRLGVEGSDQARSNVGDNWLAVPVELVNGAAAALRGVGNQCGPVTMRLLGEHLGDPAPLNKPAAQGVQVEAEVAPAKDDSVPAAQGVHAAAEGAPVAEDHLPAAHEIQVAAVVAPVADDQVPAGHAEQPADAQEPPLE